MRIEVSISINVYIISFDDVWFNLYLILLFFVSGKFIEHCFPKLEHLTGKTRRAPVLYTYASLHHGFLSCAKKLKTI